MHDMNNTRKEIAARLGFAAQGAKVSFDTYTDMVNELRRITADSANVQYDWYTAANTWLGRKRTSGNKEIAVEANRAYDAVEREMRPKWRQSRPGTKAKFAPQIDEAEQELKAWTKKLGYYPDMAKVNIRPNTVMLWFYDQKGKATQLASKLRSVAASMNLSPSAITSEEGRHPAYDGGAARDVGQVTVDYNRSTKAARPGAKAEFTNIFGHDLAEETVALYEERLVSYRKALANADLLVKKANSLLRRDDQQASNEVVGIARIMESAMKSPRGFSRPGTKTRMTREQTEEQKAGLKIMSAADPAVGAKIATLIKEGKPQDQAVAIALDMKRRGEL